jgi:hypothetical protein
MHIMCTKIAKQGKITSQSGVRECTCFASSLASLFHVFNCSLLQTEGKDMAEWRTKPVCKQLLSTN